MEEILTGFCKSMDQSRMVIVEDGEVSCAYLSCPHVVSCQLAMRIRAALEESHEN